MGHLEHLYNCSQIIKGNYDKLYVMNVTHIAIQQKIMNMKQYKEKTMKK